MYQNLKIINHIKDLIKSNKMWLVFGQWVNNYNKKQIIRFKL